MKCTCGTREHWRVVHYHTYLHKLNGRGGGAVVRTCKSSLVRCDKCGASWRTSAKYVDTLKDADKYNGEPFFTETIFTYKGKEIGGRK